MKKIVHYDDTRDHHIGPKGSAAFIYTVDHPDVERVSNETLVRTSAIQSYDKNTGEFETLNTIYKPVSNLLGNLNVN